MADFSDRFEALVAQLSADPGFARMAQPGAGILIWSGSGETLLWSSAAAAGLRDAIADEEGRTLPLLKARARLKTLAAGLAPRQGIRLERLWLDPFRPAMPVTCACRLASLGSETVLVTVIVGTVPKGPSRPRPASPQGGHETSEPAPEAAPRIGSKPRDTIRFIWQMDAETRFNQVSPELAAVVGPAASNILGKTWEEVSRTVADDPDGAVASYLARGQTWSGQGIAWAVADGSRQVPVDWAGMPVYGPGRRLVGFRGFGLLRTDAIRDRAGGAVSEPGPGAAAPSAEAPGPLPPDEETGDPAETAGSGGNWFEELRERVASSMSQIAGGPPEGWNDPDGGGEPDDHAAAEADRPAPSRSRSARTEPASGLSSAERNAFREIARALGARIDPVDDTPGEPDRPPEPARTAAPAPLGPAPRNGEPVLEGLPAGILVHRGEQILFANRVLLDLVGYEGIEPIMDEGGLLRLFKGSPALLRSEEPRAPLALTDRRHESRAVEVRLSSTTWDGAPATLMLVRPVPEPEASQRLQAADAEARALAARVRELEAILDTATDGVIALDETGRILSLNRSAEALFGYDQREVVGDAMTVLLAPESHIVALEYLEGLRAQGVASLLNDGREVLGRVRQGGTIPLFMTMGAVSESPERQYCAVLRDITAFKKAERELIASKQAAEEASAQKSDLLAKISHEIRTPLNAIIGFAEVMLEERFGPIGNDRYRDYLKDVHASGAHVMSLVNDLLDLAKIEAGRMDMSFTSVNLNELTSSCFTLLQPQAARERIVMRTSFAAKLPPVVADERSVRQIVLNLVSNAIKFTDAGGQVILSTALTDRGEVAFRVRDTGIGMTEKEIESALEPFRQLAIAHKRGGTGLGLPLTKALVEANRGALRIVSNPNEGTLVEVIFPSTRVLAQ